MTVSRGDPSAGASPEHQVYLRSYLDLPRDFQLNASVHYVADLPALNIPAHVRFDLGLRWQVSKTVEAGVWGQNLLDPRHQESTTNSSALRTEIPRSFLAKVTLRF